MIKRGRNQTKVTPYSRDYRRSLRWNMGLPPSRRPPSRWQKLRHRVLDPVFYLKAVILSASVALVALPLGADALNAALKSATSTQGRCRVMSVIDGDTVSLWCDGRGIERARLTGYDAPELFSPSCLTELLAAQQATWALRLAIFRADRMQVDFKGSDRYRRALVGMRLDGMSVARMMIDHGHGRAYDGGKRGGWCPAADPAVNKGGDAWQGIRPDGKT